MGCTSLTSIDIPNSVLTIGEYAFSGCSNLTFITIGKGVINIGEKIFDGCKSLRNIHSSIIEINDLNKYEEIFDEDENEFVLITFEDEDIYSYLDPRYHPGDPRDPTEPWGFYVDKCTLYVPEGTEWAYRNHPVFGVFKNIEIETKGKE